MRITASTARRSRNRLGNLLLYITNIDTFHFAAMLIFSFNHMARFIDDFSNLYAYYLIYCDMLRTSKS